MKKEKIILGLLILFFIVTESPFIKAQDTITAWSYKVPGAIYSFPLVEDTFLYFGCMDKSFYALHTLKGSKLWSFSTPYPVNSKALVSDGKVLFESGDRLYALNALTGDSLWSFAASNAAPVISVDFTDYHHSSPIIHKGRVYFADGLGNVNGLNLNTGQLEFQYNTGANSPIRSTPVFNDTIMYFGDWSSHVYAVSIKDCTLVWTHLLEGIRQYYGAIVSKFVLHDTLLYFGSQHDIYSPLSIYTGKPAWTFNDNKQTYLPSVPVFYGDTVIIGSTINTFRIYSIFNGNLKWEFITQGICFVHPVIEDTVLYMNTSNFGNTAHLYMIDVRNGNLMNELHFPNASPTSPVISGDLLYIGDNNGLMKALHYKKLLVSDSLTVSMDTTTVVIPPLKKTDSNFRGVIAISNVSAACDYISTTIEKTGNPGTGLVCINLTNNHFLPKTNYNMNYTIVPANLNEGSYSMTLTLKSRRNPKIVLKKTIIFSITGTTGLLQPTGNVENCKVYPVPANNKIYFSLSGQKTGPVQISIFSLDGKKVYVKTIDCKTPSMVYELSVAELKKLNGGVALYKVTTATNTYSGTIIKE